MSGSPGQAAGSRWRRGPERVGEAVRGGVGTLGSAVNYVGGLMRLLLEVGRRVLASVRGGTHRVRFSALVEQSVRVGVRSIPIVIVVQVFVGIILSLAMARPLNDYGQLNQIATIISLAVFRELGALLTAIILSGFAGASIAAEIGAMVEGEEIKALRAHALDPIRFLVVPRIVATTIMMVGLTILADVVGVAGGFVTATLALKVNPHTYIEMAQNALTLTDYGTGLFKSAVFGTIIAGLACYEGLNVTGGSVGVGRATTTTVVKSIVGLIGADCVFAIIFYSLRLW